MIPPWDDSAKNIVRSQLLHSAKYAYRILTVRSPGESTKRINLPDGEFSRVKERLKLEPTYGGAGLYSPQLSENARVFLKGLFPGKTALYHYFFAPNPITSRAGWLQKTLARVKTVQTVCSLPGNFAEANKLLFADIVIVLSEYARREFERAGVSSSRLRLVRPSIEPLVPLRAEEKRKEKLANGLDPEKRIVIFPGDYEFSQAAEVVAKAVPRITGELGDVLVVFACRMKRPGSIAVRDSLRRELESSGYGGKVRFLDRVDNMPRLVGASDVVLMPQENLYGKMDAPLVLLEAMAQEVPLVLADAPPLNEIIAFECARAVPPNDHESAALATLDLLNHPEMAVGMGRKGADAVEKVFSPDAMSRKIESIYDEVLGL